MSIIRIAKSRHTHNNEDEPPEKKILSQGDLLIKELASKQRNTNISLTEHLATEKKFEKAANFVPITSVLVGKTSLSEFEHATKKSDELEKLTRLGFSKDDIELIQDLKNGEDYVFKKHKQSDPDALRNRLSKLTGIIKEAEDRSSNTSQNTQVNNNRQFVEDALAVKPDSIETKLLKFALNNKKTLKVNFPHPLDDIKKIEKELFRASNSEETPPSCSQIRRKARKLANRVNKIEQESSDYNTVSKLKGNNSNWDVKTTNSPTAKISAISFTESERLENMSSKWDVKTANEPEKIETKKYTCAPLNYYTIRDGQIVKLKPKEVDERNLDAPRQKLSLDEIRELPKFKNYEAGTPSNKLYIKNLPNHFTKEALQSICDNCGIENVDSYQLMEGRMKGQAFITFSDKESASNALLELNGIVTKGKPMIVLYGKVKEPPEEKQTNS